MRSLASILAGFGLLALAGSAAAQTTVDVSNLDVPQYYGRGKNVSVTERDRPDYDAVGIHAGGFTFFPKVTGDIAYDSNIFATKTDEKGDSYVSLNPAIIARSNWGRHYLEASAMIQDRTYFRYSSENQLGGTIRADGRIDVIGDSFINIGASADKVYEDRGQTNYVTTAAKPVPVETQEIYMRAVYAQDRVRIRLDTAAQNFHYEDVDVAGSTTKIDEYLRNFVQARVGLRGDYALTPDTAVFIGGSYVRSSYDSGSITNAPVSTITGPTDRRDSDQYQILTGANFDLTALARGEIGVGYVDRSYDSSQYRAMSGVAVVGKIEYFPTQILTVTATVNRTPRDASFTSSGGYFSNVGTIGADYELRRNVIISALTGYEYDTFEGVDRTDTVWNVGATARYYFNQSVGLGGQLTYSDRHSSGAASTIGPQFNDLRVGLGLVFQR